MAYRRTKFLAAASSVLVTVIIGCGSNSADPAGGSGAGGANGATGGATGATGGSTSNGGTSGGGTSGSAGTSMMTSGGSAGSGMVGTGGGASGSSGTGGGSGGVAPMAGAGGAVMAGGAGSGSGAGGASAGSGGQVSTGTLTLTIEPNPNSVLSCYVSWTTAAPAASAVQFGIDAFQWEITDDAMVTEHKVLVIGMRSEKTYKIKGISGGDSGEGTFTTGKPPGQVLNGTVMINDATKRVAGWTLVNTELGSTADNRPRSPLPPAAVIYDEEGFAVWYFVHGPGKDIGGAVSTQRTDKGVVIGPTWNEQTTNGVPPREVDWAGNVIWECTHAACLPGKNVTHETQKLSNGHYVILEYVGTSAQNPVFRELDADSKEVWSLDWNALSPSNGGTGDWCHANAINIDIEKNEVYANCRWIGLLKTTYTNPTKQWLLAAKYGGVTGDFTYQGSQFSDAHSPDFYDDTNTAIFYDNGGFSGSVDTVAGPAGSGYHSRAVEYTIDATAKTAKLTWEFPGTFATPDDWYTTKWYSPFWGDVDRLSNGNMLIAGGMIGKDKPESRVFEVTKADGKVVWELRLPQNIGVYRSERITPPLVHAIAQ